MTYCAIPSMESRFSGKSSLSSTEMSKVSSMNPITSSTPVEVDDALIEQRRVDVQRGRFSDVEIRQQELANLLPIGFEWFPVQQHEHVTPMQ